VLENRARQTAPWRHGAPEPRRRVCSWVPLFVLACLLAGAASRATTIDPGAYRGWNVTRFTVRGIASDLRERLAQGLALAGENKILWTKTAHFSTERLEADLDRARLFLARNGYPQARVTAELVPRVGERAVEVVIAIDPGPAVRLREQRVEALPPEVEPRAAEILELEEGEVFSDRRIERRVRELLRALQEAGYARAAVSTRIERPASDQAHIRFLVDAGERYLFGETRLQGVPPDLHETVQRTIDVPAGTRYTPERLERAQEALRLLDLFRQIRLGTEAAGGDRLDVVADLALRTPQSLDLGVGYWTVDQLRLSADWRHRNLFGGGRGFGIELSGSRYAQGADVRAWKPVLFHSRTRGSIALRARREEEESYRLTSVGIGLAAVYLYSLNASLRPSLELAVFDLVTRTDSTASSPDPGPNLLTGQLVWAFHGLNDRLYPTRGAFLQFVAESGLPGFEPRRHYLRFEPEWIGFLPLTGDVVGAARLRVGYALPAARATQLLANKRFYGGGPSSMRGYPRRRMGPRDSDDKPVGGIAKLELSAELRLPLFWRFAGALFCDAGEVWRRRTAIEPFDLAVAPGVGLLVRTPIGPVRGDLARLITHRRDGDAESVFHISIGQDY